MKIMIFYFTQQGDTKAKFDYKLRFSQIVEFLDSTNNGFDSLDIVVRNYTLGLDSNGWKTVTDTNGTSGQRIFTFQTGDSVFTVKATIAEEALELNDSAVHLSPNEIKLDVIIENFPYSQVGTSLALVGKLQSKLETKDKTTDSGTQGTDLGGSSAYLTWFKTFQADGVDHDVTASMDEDVETDDDYDDDGDDDGKDSASESGDGGHGGERRRHGGDDGGDDNGDGEDDVEKATRITWSFVYSGQPNQLYWDPTLGTVGTPNSAVSLKGGFLALFVIVLFLM